MLIAIVFYVFFEFVKSQSLEVFICLRFWFGLFFQFLQYIHTVHIPREDLRDRVTTQWIILRPINASILATYQFNIYQFESYKIFKCFI